MHQKALSGKFKKSMKEKDHSLFINMTSFYKGGRSEISQNTGIKICVGLLCSISISELLCKAGEESGREGAVDGGGLVEAQAGPHFVVVLCRRAPQGPTVKAHSNTHAKHTHKHTPNS